MPVRGDGAEHPPALAVGGVQVDAVEVVARLLRADGEARAVYEAAKRVRGQLEAVRQRARGHARKVVGGQRDEARRVPPGAQRQGCIPAGLVKLDLGALAQLAYDLVERGRGRRGRAVRGGLDRGDLLDDGDLHVGGREGELAVVDADERVGEDRDGVAFLGDALDVGQRLEKRRAVGLELHRSSPFQAVGREV